MRRLRPRSNTCTRIDYLSCRRASLPGPFVVASVIYLDSGVRLMAALVNLGAALLIHRAGRYRLSIRAAQFDRRDEGNKFRAPVPPFRSRPIDTLGRASRQKKNRRIQGRQLHFGYWLNNGSCRHGDAPYISGRVTLHRPIKCLARK